MKSFINLLTCLGVYFLVACAGKTAMPIVQYQPQDEQMTCENIRQELSDNQANILKLIPEQQKTGKNAALGVAGAFLIVPWFFMDFSDAERVEVQAYQLRNNRLQILGQRKHCRDMPQIIRFAS